jgi:hypothetical protein
VDPGHARAVQSILGDSAWVGGTRRFARELRRVGTRHDSLLLVGTPTDEPWHMTAHLADEARLAGLPELTPTLVRHCVPLGAPPHLSVDLSRLQAAHRGDTLLVVAPDEPGEGLLQRLDDARRHGATLFALDCDDEDLGAVAHESLTVAPLDAEVHRRDATVLRPEGPFLPADLGAAFEMAQHLVTVAVCDSAPAAGRRAGFRDRLARLLDVISGPQEPTP